MDGKTSSKPGDVNNRNGLHDTRHISSFPPPEENLPPSASPATLRTPPSSAPSREVSCARKPPQKGTWFTRSEQVLGNTLRPGTTWTEPRHAGALEWEVLEVQPGRGLAALASRWRNEKAGWLVVVEETRYTSAFAGHFSSNLPDFASTSTPRESLTGNYASFLILLAHRPKGLRVPTPFCMQFASLDSTCKWHPLEPWKCSRDVHHARSAQRRRFPALTTIGT